MRRHKALPREGRARPRDHGHELRMAGRACLRGRCCRPGRVRLGGIDGRDEACPRKRHAVPGKARAHLQAFRPIPRPPRRTLGRTGCRARASVGEEALRRLRGDDRPSRRQRKQDPARAHRREQHRPRNRTTAADPRPAGAQSQPAKAQPFTGKSMLADLTLDYADVEKKGLWLTAHCYAANEATGQTAERPPRQGARRAGGSSLPPRKRRPR